MFFSEVLSHSGEGFKPGREKGGTPLYRSHSKYQTQTLTRGKTKGLPDKQPHSLGIHINTVIALPRRIRLRLPVAQRGFQPICAGPLSQNASPSFLSRSAVKKTSHLLRQEGQLVSRESRAVTARYTVRNTDDTLSMANTVQQTTSVGISLLKKNTCQRRLNFTHSGENPRQLAFGSFLLSILPK